VVGEVHGIVIELSDVAAGMDKGWSGLSTVKCLWRLNGGASVVEAHTQGRGNPSEGS
jgi:hypothetical protein